MIELTVEPYTAPASQALAAALEADIDERYAADGGADGGDAQTAAVWAVRPEQVTPPAGVFVVARLDGEPVGCGAVRPVLGGPADHAELKRMYTAPAARRRGVSRAVLARLEGEARVLGYRWVQLETGTRQPEAIALYEATGYSRIAPYGQFEEHQLTVCFGKDL
ncbi:MAG TPA: GNAT family N-acetyltransferase [Acidimicrobiales bacterium]|nr:GNAT family N-acetyltransferase [Acidimicrobiales bacterium]